MDLLDELAMEHRAATAAALRGFVWSLELVLDGEAEATVASVLDGLREELGRVEAGKTTPRVRITKTWLEDFEAAAIHGAEKDAWGRAATRTFALLSLTGPIPRREVESVAQGFADAMETAEAKLDELKRLAREAIPETETDATR